MPDAIDFQAGLGWDNVRGRMAELAAYVRRFDGLAGLRLATPADPRMCGGMTAFWLPPGGGAEGVRRRLWERRIEAVIGEWPDGLMPRVSTHFYNTRDVKAACPGPYTEAQALAADCWPAAEVTANVNTAELGNLRLTPRQEQAIVAFLRTLSDGYQP